MDNDSVKRGAVICLTYEFLNSLLGLEDCEIISSDDNAYSDIVSFKLSGAYLPKVLEGCDYPAIGPAYGGESLEQFKDRIKTVFTKYKKSVLDEYLVDFAK